MRAIRDEEAASWIVEVVLGRELDERGVWIGVRYYGFHAADVRSIGELQK
jgi:hypothetical protein